MERERDELSGKDPTIIYYLRTETIKTRWGPDHDHDRGPEDRRALSAVFCSHINLYGRFRLDMNKRLDLEVTAA